MLEELSYHALYKKIFFQDNMELPTSIWQPNPHPHRIPAVARSLKTHLI
jgi:hypothetical protein